MKIRGKNSERERWRKGGGDVPWGVDVRTVVNQQVDDLLVPTRASNVDGKHPVEDRINWLSVDDGVSDEAIIT